MLTTPAEMIRRTRGRVTGRLRSLPILALHVHTACNCRCVMCDIWKANAERRDISEAALARHVADIRALRVRRVMLTGGEPLLHANLWALCDRLRAENIRLTLVTTGLLLEAHAAAVARSIDDVVVSLDGPAPIHDRIRRVPKGFDRVVRGLRAIGAHARRVSILARSVVQRENYAVVSDTIDAAAEAGVDRLSFLAADVFSPAFNRPSPWDEARRAEVALAADDLSPCADAIREAERRCADRFTQGFVVGGSASLWRIHAYYRALSGHARFPRVRCSAPWVSAVLEPGDALRPCFFHATYPGAGGLQATLNSADAIRFRRALDVRYDETCRRCVCSLALPLASEP
jgi:MoaA/NifB/PqqE/SkfB family radical SAM enzyme